MAYIAYASTKQRSYIAALLAQAGMAENDARLPMPVTSSLTTIGASVLINFLRTITPERPTVKIETEGVYRQGNVIFRVKRSRQTGRLYAMTLDMDGPTKTFGYAAGAIYRLAPADRLTLEQAKAIGHMYGFCVVCGKLLTDEKSVKAGIGPVCAKRV